MALIPPIGVNPAVARPIAPSTTTATDPTAATRGNSFGDSVTKALDDLQASQSKADSLARDAATGRLQNIEEYLIAASDAQLSTQLTVAVRNKAVESFNEIMRMQI